MIRIRSKIRIKRDQYDGVSFFLCFYITLMILAEMFETVLPSWFRYVDEVFAVVALAYLGLHLLLGRVLKKMEAVILGSMLALILLGIISNMIHGLHYTWGSVAMDIFLFLKVYVSMVTALIAIREERITAIYRYILAISKFFQSFLVVMAAADGVRNGILADFSFTYRYYGSLSWWMILFFVVIYSDKQSSRLRYFLYTLLVVAKNKSGLGMLSLGVVVVVYLFAEQSRRIRWYHFVLMLAIGAAVSWGDIRYYLMNTKAPRYLLLYYGFITANRFFPLGSGFATYASAQAARDYARLYYEYGFDRVWGMSKQAKHFIQDSYFPVVVGQFGYLGAVVFAWMIYMILKEIVLPIREKCFQCGALIAITTWLAAGIGFLGVSTTWGCCMLILVILLNRAGNNQNAMRGIGVDAI